VDQIARKTCLESLSAEEDICNLLFSHEQTRKACRVFLEWLKKHDGRASRREVSQFGRDLGQGQVEKRFRYGRKNFYTIVLRRLVDLGFIELRIGRHNDGHCWLYLPVLQPITARPPGGRNFWHVAWQICEKWNKEWRQ